MPMVSAVRNPFTYGDPITSAERFIGRQREVDQIMSRLTNPEGESTAVVGDRRIGKTSLLKHLTAPAVHEAYGINTSNCTFVYIDLQVLGETSTPERLWKRLLQVTAERCTCVDVAATLASPYGNLDTFALDELFDAVDQQGHHIVLLFDEFDSITRNPHFGPDFFFGLRSLSINHAISIITSSQRDLIDLCHSPEVRSSPFFNIFATVQLRPLSALDSVELVDRALAGTTVIFDKSDLALAWEFASGHPFFLQMVGYMLYESYCEGLDREARISVVTRRFRSEAAGHFATYWHASDDTERITLTAMALLGIGRAIVKPRLPLEEVSSIFSRAEPALASLERRGLVLATGDDYELFSSAFADWVLAEISATLSEQQSYEEWLDTRQNRSSIIAPIKTELSQILPGVRVRYREMIVSWVSNPSNLAAAARLLQTAMGGLHGW